MAEYIEREAASKMYDGIPMWGSVAQMMLDCIPAADVVEVVRCKDCKHWDCGVCELHSEKPSQYSTGLDIEMFADDFCSYGERRESE